MFPDWYKGGFPDAEKLLRDLFEPLLTDVDFVPWFPAPDAYKAQLDAGKAIVRYARTGGRINFEESRDEPRIQIGVVARSRQLSWDIAEFHRQILWTFHRGAVVPNTPHLLQVSEEVLGPQLIPENIIEPRLVPVTFGLITRNTTNIRYRNHL